MSSNLTRATILASSSEVEQSAVNRSVAGSTPASPAILIGVLKPDKGYGSLPREREKRIRATEARG